jgi:hypothetical protein
MAYTPHIVESIIKLFIGEEFDLIQYARDEIVKIGEEKFINRCVQYRCCPININKSSIYTIQRIFALFSRNKVSALRFYLSGKSNIVLNNICKKKGIKLSCYARHRKNAMINCIIERLEEIMFYNIV